MLWVHHAREQPCPEVSPDLQHIESILYLTHSLGIQDDVLHICRIQEDPDHILCDGAGTFYNLLRG